MGRILFFLLFATLGCVAFSQTKGIRIKGIVKDSVANKLVNRALISVIRSEDSLIVSYNYSDSLGQFHFDSLPPDNYKLIISYPGFTDYTEEVVLKEQLDLGIQFLTPKYKIMEEVTIYQRRAAIGLKNDTLQFLADSFRVRANATVEDLLRALPGVSVNREGQISVHGRRVNQVLVDGEEFFGNDPTIVTQNLPAKIVDKVQVFDKKSELSTLTGIDDGKSSKTINVKLKEKSKKGYFGKLVLGSNLNKNWNNSLMINSFKNKRQLSIFGVTSNTGRTLIDNTDKSKYGFVINDKLGSGVSSLRGNYYDVGVPRSSGGGLHYANKWNEEKISFNGDITSGSLGNKGVQTNSIQSFIDDSVILSSERYLIDNRRTEHSARGKFDAKLDSTSSLSTTVDAQIGKLITNNSLISQTQNLTHLINKSRQSYNSASTYNNYSSNVEWKKKIDNKGRNIYVSVRYESVSNESSGDLMAINQYYLTDGSLQKEDIFNYKRYTSSNDRSFASKLAYTKPVFWKSFMSFNYDYSTSRFASNWSLLDNTAPGSQPIDSLSSKYNYLISSHAGGFTFQSHKNKFNFTAGQTLALTKYDQKELLTKNSARYSFFNVLSKASVSYAFAKLTSLKLMYSSFHTPPTLRQIQPVTDNTNSVFLYKGNADLRQEFTNTYSVIFNSLQLVNKRMLYSSISLTTVKNAISNNEYIGVDGRRIIQPINTRRSARIFGYIDYTFELKRLKGNWTNDVTVLYNSGINFVNGIENQINNIVYTYSTSLYKNTKKFSLNINTSVSYNILAYSNVEYHDVKFWSNKSYVSVISDLPKKFELGSNCQFLLQQRSPYFNIPNNIIQWNAHVSKKILKKENALLRLSVNNMLDQNNGYSRSILGNSVSERLTEALGRYWLLSFVLNFNNQNKK